MLGDRPSFKEMYTITSKYVESIAGYLDMGFNPFAGVECPETEKEGVEDSSAVQVIPTAGASD